MGWGSTYGNDGISWSDSASVGGRDCAELLDAGKGGLDWLHNAIHRYCAAVEHGLLSPLPVNGQALTDDASIDTMYYAEKDVNTAVMHAKAGDLKNALGGKDATAGANALLAGQIAAVRALPDAWSDSQAAAAAHERLSAFTTYAGRQLEAVQAVQTQLDAAATAIYGFVKTKAAFVKGFDCSSDGQLWVAGHSMRLSGSRQGDDPVYWIIYGAERNLGGNRADNDVAAETYDKIRTQFPDLPERQDDSMVTDAMFDAAESTCKEWVQEHFGPAVQDAVGEFVNQCTICKQAIAGVYDTLRQAFDEVKLDKFPQPGFAGPPPPPLPAAQRPIPPPAPQQVPTQQVPTQHDSTQHDSTQHDSTQHDSTQHDSTQPSGGPSRDSAASPSRASIDRMQEQVSALGGGLEPAVLGGGLAPLLSDGMQIAELGEEVLDQLDPVAEGVGQFAQQAAQQVEQWGQSGASLLDQLGVAHPADVTAMPGLPSDVRTLADLALPGGHLTIGQTPDGDVTAQIVGPDGAPREFSVGVRDGVPFVAAGPEPAAPPPSPHSPPHSDAPEAGRPASSGPPAAAPPRTAPPEGLSGQQFPAREPAPAERHSPAAAGGLPAAAAAADDDTAIPLRPLPSPSRTVTAPGAGRSASPQPRSTAAEPEPGTGAQLQDSEPL